MMMAGLKGPGLRQNYDGSGLRIAIVHARWNAVIVDSLVAGAKKSLLSAGVSEENIIIQNVPGSYELPFAVQSISATSRIPISTHFPMGDPSLSDNTHPSQPPQLAPRIPTAPFDAVIAIGVLIKGETMHFEYIADAVTHGLMRIQLNNGVPVIFGLLTVLNEEQGLERAGLGKHEQHNHGEDWGNAAVELGLKQKGWSHGMLL